jgi:hypothetical protein
LSTFENLSDNIQLFPDKWKPPLRLDKSFDYSNLNEDTLRLIKNGEYEIEQISDELYLLKISDETLIKKKA